MIGVVRRLLLFMLLLGSGGMLAELLLIGHTEPFWLLPLALLGLMLLAVALWRLRPRRATIRALQAVALACIASGCIGLFQHSRPTPTSKARRWSGRR